MRAAVLRAGEIVVDEIAEPPAPRDDQLTIAVRACGTCGSDVHARWQTDEFVDACTLVGQALFAFDAGRDLVLGHEYAGHVVATGPAVEHVAVGDLVTGLSIVTDARGVRRCAGYSNEYPGGFAERVTADARFFRRVPDGLGAAEASLAEPMLVGAAAVRRSGLAAGEPAAVIGTGPVGLAIIAALRLAGVGPIVAADPSPARRRLATRTGATTVADVTTTTWRQAWDALDRDAPPVVFETTGVGGMLDRLFLEVPPFSTIVTASVNLAPETMLPVAAVWKNLTVKFCMEGGMRLFEQTLGAIGDGGIDAASLITARVGLDDVAWVLDTLRHPHEHVKIVVEPWR